VDLGRWLAAEVDADCLRGLRVLGFKGDLHVLGLGSGCLRARLGDGLLRLVQEHLHVLLLPTLRNSR